VPGALGEHTISGDPTTKVLEGDFTRGGRPLAWCAVSVTISAVTHYFDPFNVTLPFPSISYILSHEALELSANPQIDKLYGMPRFVTCCAFSSDAPTVPIVDGAPFVADTIFGECCDPIGTSRYTITADGVAVTVSNFVSEASFQLKFWLFLNGFSGDFAPAPGTRWDWLGLLTGPFQGIAGGVASLHMLGTTAIVSSTPIVMPEFVNPTLKGLGFCATGPYCATATTPSGSQQRVALPFSGTGALNEYIVNVGFADPEDPSPMEFVGVIGGNPHMRAAGYEHAAHCKVRPTPDVAQLSA
jgi:hypothetical protein